MTDERILEEGHTAGGYHHNVVTLADIRLARGWKKHSAPTCEHRDLVYGTQERRVECKSCGASLDGFDAFMVLTRHFDGMQRDLDAKRAAAEAARQAVIVRRAAKAIDQSWGRKMAPNCPHCRGGLLPEDFETVRNATGRDFEIARRSRAAQPSPPQEPA